MNIFHFIVSLLRFLCPRGSRIWHSTPSLSVLSSWARAVSHHVSCPGATVEAQGSVSWYRWSSPGPAELHGTRHQDRLALHVGILPASLTPIRDTQAHKGGGLAPFWAARVCIALHLGP